MKCLIRWCSVLGLILFCGLGFAQLAIAAGPNYPMASPNPAQPALLLVTVDMTCSDFTQKIDLNNANIGDFAECQGFYPNLASLIVQNGPYDSVNDVLKIPGLSDRQKSLLKSQLKNFVVTPPLVPLEMRMPQRSASPYLG